MEIWKDIPGYVGLYQVSDQGGVRSVERAYVNADGVHRLLKSKTLKQGTHEFGYRRVNLYDGKTRNKGKTFLVHYLVLMAFVGPRPAGLLGCHNDGNPGNNRVGNLRYDTQSGNMADRVAHGTANRDERHGNAKLTNEQVKEIRKHCAEGKLTQRAIAQMFSVCPSTITMIKKGETRNHA